MKNIFWKLLLVGLFVFFASSSAVLAGAKENKLMPDFSLPLVPEGTMINSDDYNGKILLVNFFATWCPPCLKEIPTLVSLQNKYTGQDFTVLGISVDKKENLKALERLMAKTEINYPVLLAEPITKKEFGASFLPMTFLVDKEGMMIKSYFGERKSSVFEKDIDGLLQ